MALEYKMKQWPQDWKRSVFIPVPKKGNAKECSNYCMIALISHASKAMLKILQARFQQYVNRKLPDLQTGFNPIDGSPSGSPVPRILQARTLEWVAIAFSDA